MSYGKSALLERRIRALVRETAALLREADEMVKIKPEILNKAYKIADYVYFATNDHSFKYIDTINPDGNKGTTTTDDSDWDSYARAFNTQANSTTQAEGEAFIKAEIERGNAFAKEFTVPAPAAPAPSAPKASTALKEIQKILGLTPDGIWGKQTAAGWEGFIEVAKRKAPGLPDDMATNWKGTAPSVNVSGTKGFKPDYTGMLAFMKAVKEIPDPGGSAVGPAATAAAKASSSTTTAEEEKIFSQVTTQGPVKKGEPVDITSTYTSNGERLDINDIVVTVKGTGEVAGVSKAKNPFFPTGRNGKVKVKTNDLAPGTYEATVTGDVLIGGKRVPKSSNVVTFTVKQ